jgi:hypothetical protein
MNIQRSLLIPAIIWEIIRFFFLFLVNFTLFKSIIDLKSQTIFWLIGLAASGLIMPAGLFFLYKYTKDNNTPLELLLNILRLGKILQFFPIFLLITWEVINEQVHLSSLSSLGILLIIFVFDLIFLFLLLSYKVKPKED